MDSSQSDETSISPCTKCAINALQKYETICLKEVCRRGKNQKSVRFLEKDGIDTTIKDTFDGTALMHACLRGHTAPQSS